MSGKSKVAQYLDHTEEQLERILSDPERAELHQKARLLLERMPEIRRWIAASNGDRVEGAIAFAVIMEGVTQHALSERLVDAHLERIERIRKTPTITADDLRAAELKHAKRTDQAADLGISARYHRKLRKELLGE